MNSIEVLPVLGLPEIHEGDDLAELITDRADLVDGDVIVVAQKIVSKAEGATVAVPTDENLAQTRLALARERAVRVYVDSPGVDSPGVLVVRTGHGLVCANAGIDASNAQPGTLILLPVDPDASARELLTALRSRMDGALGVVVTDTFGRAWRRGQTDVAIGVAGIACIRDEHSDTDRSGRRLEVTEVAVVDEIAAAADLVRRKSDGVPVVIVRGLDWDADPDARVSDVLRDTSEDLFPRGRGELARALAQPERLRPMDEAALRRVIEGAHTVVGDGVDLDLRQSAEGWTIVPRLALPRSQVQASARLGAAAATVAAVVVDAGWVARLQMDPEPHVTLPS